MPVQNDISNDDDLLCLLKQYIKANIINPAMFLGLVHRLTDLLEEPWFCPYVKSRLPVRSNKKKRDKNISCRGYGQYRRKVRYINRFY